MNSNILAIAEVWGLLLIFIFFKFIIMVRNGTASEVSVGIYQFEEYTYEKEKGVL